MSRELMDGAGEWGSLRLGCVGGVNYVSRADVALTAGSQLAGAPAADLRHWDSSRPWIPAGRSLAETTLKIDFGAAPVIGSPLVGVVGFAGARVSSAARMQVQASTSTAADPWAGLDVKSSPSSGLPAVVAPGGVATFALPKPPAGIAKHADSAVLEVQLRHNSTAAMRLPVVVRLNFGGGTIATSPTSLVLHPQTRRVQLLADMSGSGFPSVVVDYSVAASGPSLTVDSVLLTIESASVSYRSAWERPRIDESGVAMAVRAHRETIAGLGSLPVTWAHWIPATAGVSGARHWRVRILDGLAESLSVASLAIGPSYGGPGQLWVTDDPSLGRRVEYDDSRTLAGQGTLPALFVKRRLGVRIEDVAGQLPTLIDTVLAEGAGQPFLVSLLPGSQLSRALTTMLAQPSGDVDFTINKSTRDHWKGSLELEEVL